MIELKTPKYRKSADLTIGRRSTARATDFAPAACAGACERPLE
jgi:hypothetical protein